MPLPASPAAAGENFIAREDAPISETLTVEPSLDETVEIDLGNY
jgi:hypothetical protein